jgi:predicted anti-sigma-YlaC factor YlaD
MKCKHVYLYICDNLDAEMNSPRCRKIRKHLATCPDCSALLDSVKKTVSLYRSVPSPDVPSSAHKRLVKTINLFLKSRPHPTSLGRGSDRT